MTNTDNKISSYIIDNELQLERVIDTYYSYIETILRNGTTPNLNAEDKEEIISDVFLVIWKNKNKLNTELEFTPYIAGITKRLILKKYSFKENNLDISEYEERIADSFNIEEIVKQNQIEEVVINKLKLMGELEYKIFTDFYYEGRKIIEIAKELNVSQTSVKTKLHRIRKKLKKVLEKGGYNYE